MYKTVGIPPEDEAAISRLMYDHELTKGEAISYYYVILHGRRLCEVSRITRAYPQNVRRWKISAVKKMEREANVY